MATPGDRMTAKVVTSARYQDESAMSDGEGDMNRNQNSQPSIDRLTVALNSSTLSLLQQEAFSVDKQSAV